MKEEKLYSAVYINDAAAVKRLLEEGADVNGLNERGETPLVLATDLPDSHPVREEFLDLFRQYAPELVMEAYCSPGQLP